MTLTKSTFLNIVAKPDNSVAITFYWKLLLF